MPRQIVVDTCVLVAALRSRRGASFRLVSLIGKGRFDINVSVPLVLEYEDATTRIAREVGLTATDIDDLLDYICRVARRRQIFFLWRPFLRDSADDLVLELAVESGADTIVTHNLRDFDGAEHFGIDVLTPGEFLRGIGEPR